MLNGGEKRELNVPIFVWVGVCHRLTWSTKVFVDRAGETSALKRLNVGGVVIVGSDRFV